MVVAGTVMGVLCLMKELLFLLLCGTVDAICGVIVDINVINSVCHRYGCNYAISFKGGIAIVVNRVP